MRTCWWVVRTEGNRTPVGRPDFKSGEGRQTSLVGSTPTLFRHVDAREWIRGTSGSRQDLLQILFPGESSGLVARVGEFTVDNHVELARFAGLNVHQPAPARFDPSLHTEGFGLVASGSAVMNVDGHEYCLDGGLCLAACRA